MMGKQLFFVGSYAEASEGGLYTFTLDSATGALTLLNRVGGYRNPNFLDIDHEGRKVYAAAETAADAEEPSALALAFAFDPSDGQLHLLNEEKTVDRANCHIQFNAADKYVVATSYSGAMIGLLPVLEDGRLGSLSDAHRHEGSGPNPKRQDRAHPHSAYTDLDNRFVYVPDLGLDRVKIYKPDTRAWKLIPSGEAVSPAGAGPRHMAFHPDQPYVYVINELDSTITVFSRNAEDGTLKTIHTVSTLPESYEQRESNTCAEIQITPDGKFVYGSNRGHDSIAAYSVDQASGRLTLIEIVSSMGQKPRNFAVSPDGRFLVAAHQDSGNLVVFRIDEHTGKLQDTGHRAEAAKAVCVKFWKG